MITNLSLIALAIFAATAAPLPQEPAPSETTDEGWQVFDGVALIVNDEIVTLRQLNTSMNKARGNAEATTQEDADALRDDVITDSIMASEAANASPKIRQLPIAPLLGEAIKRIADESSVSSLFD